MYDELSGCDKCTMFSDKKLVNRRNLKKEVTTAANACRRFCILEVEARIVAATLHISGMNKVDDQEPTTCKLSPSATVEDKKSYLNKVSALVVDQFVVDELSKCRVTFRHMFIDVIRADTLLALKRLPILEN